MLRWEKLPILGENPVFCYELWRSWRGRTVIWLLLIMLGIVFLSIVMPATLQGTFRQIGLWQGGPGTRGSPGAFASWMGIEAAIEGRSPHATQTGFYCDGYLMLLVLKWPVGPATRYLVAALAAAALASDRAGRRLEPLLVTRLSPRGILLGKFLALALPFSVATLVTALIAGPLAIAAGTVPHVVLLSPAADIVALLAAVMVGLRAGASSRHPAVAMGTAVFVVAVILPIVASWLPHAVAMILHLSYLPKQPGMYSVPWPTTYFGSSLIYIGCYALVFVALALSTKRVLTRAAE